MKKTVSEIFKDLRNIEPEEHYRRRLKVLLLLARAPETGGAGSFLKNRRLSWLAAGLMAVLVVASAVVNFVSSPSRLAGNLESNDFKADIADLNADIDIQLAEVKYYSESARAVSVVLGEAAQNGDVSAKELDHFSPAGGEIDRLLDEIVL